MKNFMYRIGQEPHHSSRPSAAETPSWYGGETEQADDISEVGMSDSSSGFTGRTSTTKSSTRMELESEEEEYLSLLSRENGGNHHATTSRSLLSGAYHADDGGSGAPSSAAVAAAPLRTVDAAGPSAAAGSSRRRATTRKHYASSELRSSPEKESSLLFDDEDSLDSAPRGQRDALLALAPAAPSPALTPSRMKRRDEICQELHSGMINDEEDCEGEDPLINAMDRLEDEIDEHTTDLLPLQVKLLLEQNVFGWSHLLSDIVGHVLHTSIAAFLTYQIVSWLLLSDARHPILQWLRRHHDHGSSSSGDLPGDSGDGRTGKPILGMSWELFVWIRTICTVMAAWVAFRTVRRRRRVWLHAAYGTSAYERDQERREHSLREVDRTTVLGRIANSLLEGRNILKRSRVRKKIRKAHSRFKRKHARQQKRTTPRPVIHDSLSHVPLSDNSESSPQGLKDNASLMLLPPCSGRGGQGLLVTKSVCQDHVRVSEIEYLPYAHGGFFGAAPFMLADPVWVNILRELMPDVYVEVARRVFAPTPKLIHWAENNPVVAAYGSVHENEAHGRITTLEWDVFVDPYLVNRLLAAIQALEEYNKGMGGDSSGGDARGSRIDENTSSRARDILKKEVHKRTILLLEKMLIAHGSLSQLLMEQTGKLKRYNFSRVKRQRRSLGGGIFARQWLAVYARALQMGMDPLSVTQETVDGEDESCTTSASSSTDDESTPGFNENAGPRAARAGTSKDVPKATIRASRARKVKPPPRSIARATSLRTAGLCPPTNMVESIEIVRQMMGAPLGLVLDLKSRHVPKKVWALLVNALRDCGARVEGLASFIPDEIRDVSMLCATPVKEVFFFHSAGDMQNACHTGQVRRGDTVFFNAGSLLWDHPQSGSVCDTAKSLLFLSKFDPEETKRKYAFQPYAFIEKDGDRVGDEGNSPCGDFPFSDGNSSMSQCSTQSLLGSIVYRSTIADYKRHYNLNIGLYCQEFAIDETAIDLLVRFVNANPEIYDLGLSWGGVNGYTVRGIQPGRFTNTDGFWNQRYTGIPWNPDLAPGEVEEEGPEKCMPIQRKQSTLDYLRAATVAAAVTAEVE